MLWTLGPSSCHAFNDSVRSMLSPRVMGPTAAAQSESSKYVYSAADLAHHASHKSLRERTNNGALQCAMTVSPTQDGHKEDLSGGEAGEQAAWGWKNNATLERHCTVASHAGQTCLLTAIFHLIGTENHNIGTFYPTFHYLQC